MSRRRFFMELSYLGTNYHGWQTQPNAVTVQQSITNALNILFDEDIALVGCGRTDTGVHALQFFAHFDCSEEFDTNTLLSKLNGLLKQDISIFNIFEVNIEHHARFDAQSRSYIYKIHKRKDAHKYGRSYYFRGQLDFDLMNEASKLLEQKTDYGCFSKSKTQVKTNICDIRTAKWLQTSEFDFEFHIKADRFLRGMVRAIVGTMIQVGTGKTSCKELESIIRSKNRGMAGPSVPPEGLYLYDIKYPFL